MPVPDDLRVSAERADRELDAVHDFFEHSKIVWRSFQILVGEGHKVSAENLATGTRIDQDGLVRLAPRDTREYLATFTFRQSVSAFEVFLFNFLRVFLGRALLRRTLSRPNGVGPPRRCPVGNVTRKSLRRQALVSRQPGVEQLAR